MYDYLIVLLLMLALVALSRRFHTVDVLAVLSRAQRADLYSKALGPLSIVASIATAALAVYSSSTGTRMTMLRAVYGDVILRQFLSAALAPGVAVVGLFVAYVADLGYVAAWARWLAIGCLVFVAVRTGRALYFYVNVLKTAGDDKAPAATLRTIDELPVPARRA